MIIWIIDNQLARRNINDLTRNYLLGTRYGEEKKDSNRPKFSQLVRHDAGIIGDKSTSKVIANQTKVDPRTVERAGIFAKAINTIVTNTGISRKDILTGIIKGTMKDINALALLDPGTQQRVITLIKEKKESDVKDATKKVEKEERDRVIREIEEKERQTKEIQRKEREERERIEIERIRAERAEKERIENERIEKERLVREKAKKER